MAESTLKIDSIMSSDEKVIHEYVEEDSKLENLGYQQELRRSFGLLGMIGFAFSIVTSWTALGGVLIVGVQSGGPPVMIYSWIGVSLFGLAVAYSMAEMCSAYPLAGGQYSWVAVIAPPSIARGMSWVTEWFMIVGILAMGATNNFIGANFILGQANLSFPGYVIQRWHTVLLAYLIAIVCTAVNIYGPHLLDRISRFILLWNILSFVIVIITILATNDHKQPASFVFNDFQNFTGFSTGFAAILGLLQSSFGMCCYDVRIFGSLFFNAGNDSSCMPYSGSIHSDFSYMESSVLLQIHLQSRKRNANSKSSFRHLLT